MKIFMAAILTFTFIICSLVYAEGETPGNSDAGVVITVKGLVCEFCVKTIEKVLRKQDAVKDVSVDLKTAEVRVSFKEGRNIGDERIKELLKDAGYEADTIKRF